MGRLSSFFVSTTLTSMFTNSMIRVSLLGDVFLNLSAAFGTGTCFDLFMMVMS